VGLFYNGPEHHTELPDEKFDGRLMRLQEADDDDDANKWRRKKQHS